MIVKPGPVVDFLLQNQSVQNPNYIDWTKVIVIAILSSRRGFMCMNCGCYIYDYFHLGKENAEEPKNQG